MILYNGNTLEGCWGWGVCGGGGIAVKCVLANFLLSVPTWNLKEGFDMEEAFFDLGSSTPYLFLTHMH